jgi:hypothetical protein
MRYPFVQPLLQRAAESMAATARNILIMGMRAILKIAAFTGFCSSLESANPRFKAKPVFRCNFTGA